MKTLSACFPMVLCFVVGCGGGVSSDGGPAADGSRADGAVVSNDASGDAHPASDGSASTSQAPNIVSFVAMPASLPAGGGSSMLTWQVQNATSLSIDQGVGAVTGTSTSVQLTATTIYTLTATNAYGTATASTAVVIGQNPSTDPSGRYAAMVAPTGGETFTAPATLRLIGAAHDPNVFTNCPTDGLGGNASQVEFFVDDAMVLAVDGANAEYWVFKGFASNIASGMHRVWVRGIYTNPSLVLDSDPMIITVNDPPTYGQTVNLTSDVTISGSTGYTLTGTATSRVRLNGNGHSIVSTDGASGSLVLQFVDVFDLGNESDTSQSAINVTTTGALTLEDSNFDTSNTFSLTLNGAATASIQRNTFRSNMRMPLGQEPDSYSADGASYPVLQITGSAQGNKVLAGNNVGAGWVEFDNMNNWIVGGDTDADTNVLIGPRVGIATGGSTAMQVRRNYSHHVYYGGWSQGANFEIEATTSSTIEHNVIYGSSWPVRGCSMGCQFQYNLVLSAGHEWMQPDPGASVHHNVFLGGDNDVGGFYAYNDPAVPNAPTINIYNNTIDGSLSPGMATSLLTDTSTGAIALNSNAFCHVPNGPTLNVLASTTADYNGFFDTTSMNYSDGRTPAHDVTGSDPMITTPPTAIFDGDESSVWQRGTTVASILAAYRMRYTPKANSPLIDVGDPSGGAGNDIGAVGAGQANAADLFGMP